MVRLTPEVALTEQRTPWLRLIILVALVVGIGWAWNHWAIWPLKIVVVLFHELGHALAAVLTGGEVLEIELSPMEGGHTISRGGSRLIILNAGYLGSLLTGAALLYAARSSLSARGGTLALSLIMLVAPLILMPWLGFGQIFTFLAGVVLVPVALFLPGIALRWGLRGLGVFSVLYAAYDVWSDILGPGLSPGGGSDTSDASQLAALTGVPSIVWGLIWLVAGATLLIAARRQLV